MAEPSCVGRGAGAECSEAAGLGRERAAAEREPHMQSALRCARLEPLTHVALRIETSVYPSAAPSSPSSPPSQCRYLAVAAAASAAAATSPRRREPLALPSR